MGGIIDTGKGLPGLTGLNRLNGFSALDDASQRAFMNKQIEAGIASANDPISVFDTLYRNKQFIDMFGEDAFDKLNFNQRLNMFEHQVLLDEYKERFNPYVEAKVQFRDKDGNYYDSGTTETTVDPDKGMGDATMYEQGLLLSNEGLKELLEDPDFQSPADVRKAIKARKEMKEAQVDVLEGNKKYLEEKGGIWKLLSDARPDDNIAEVRAAQNNPIVGIAEGVADAHAQSRTKLKFEDIYSRDLKRQVAALSDEIYAAREEIDKLPDEEVEELFFKIIKPVEGENPGDPTLYAHFTENGDKRSKEVESFGIPEMREYIAKATTIKKHLGPRAAYDAMDFDTREYLAEHQSNWESAKRHGEEFLITGVSYGSAHVRGVINALDMADNEKYTVYVDNKGNIVQTDQVDVNNQGKHVVKDEDGNEQVVHQVQMTKTELNHHGKDTEGNDKYWLWNDQFMTDAQRFNTLDEDEIKRARKVGASSSQLIYAPGDEAGLAWQTAKMSAFGLTDALIMAVPSGLGALSKAMSTTSKIAKAFSAVENVLSHVAPITGALAIGHDYGTGIFSENLQSNLGALEDQVAKIGRNTFLEQYNTNPKYKASVDQRISELANEIVKENPNISKEDAAKQAQENIEYLDSQRFAQEYKDADPDGQYSKSLQEATAAASHGANVASLTDAMKYMYVNTLGWRRFLYKSPAKMGESQLGGFFKDIKQNGARLAFEKAWNRKAELAKSFGSQSLGAGWTNWTDEMQSEGGRAISQDRFAAYLNNEYDGDGGIQAYNDIDSYMKGAVRSLAAPQTWNALLVGGLGGSFNATLNLGGVMQHLMTSEGRTAFKRMGAIEKANVLFNNGLLSNYYAKKAAYKNAKDIVEQVNKLIDDNKEFSNFADALAVNAATTDATNETDANILKYINAIRTMNLIKSMSEGKSNRGEIFDAVAMKAAPVQNILETIQRMATGNFTEEEAAEHVQRYFDANTDLARNDENTQVALNNIMTNAKYLMDVYNRINDVENTIGKHEQVLGTYFDPVVRNTILTRMAVEGILEDKYAEGEKELIGAERKADTSYSPTIQSYGTKEARQSAARGLSERVSRIESQIEEAQKIVDEKEEAVHQFEQDKDVADLVSKGHSPINALTREEQEEYKKLLSSLDNAKLSLGYYQQMRTETANLAKTLEESVGEDHSDLSAQEILSLPAIDRARMLDKANEHLYSEGQLAEIRKVREELNKRDPKLLELVQTQGRLARHIKSNSRIYSTMLSNPAAAAEQVYAMHNASVSASVAAYNDNRINAFEEQLRKNRKIPGITEEELRLSVSLLTRTLNPSLLEAMLDRDPSEAPFINRYRDILENALEFSKTMNNLQGAINNMKLSEEEAKILSDNIDALLDQRDAWSRAEVLDILHTLAGETTAETENVDTEGEAPKSTEAHEAPAAPGLSVTKEKIQTLLRRFNDIEATDSATRVITRKQREALEQKTIRELADQERTTREAEAKAVQTIVEEREAKHAEEEARKRAYKSAQVLANDAVEAQRKGEYSAKVTREKDGTVTTRFTKYKWTSHGGHKKDLGGMPISPATIADNEGITVAQLITLREKDGKYTGTIRTREHGAWVNKEVTFNSNPLAVPFSNRKQTSETTITPEATPAQVKEAQKVVEESKPVETAPQPETPTENAPKTPAETEGPKEESPKSVDNKDDKTPPPAPPVGAAGEQTGAEVQASEETPSSQAPEDSLTQEEMDRALASAPIVRFGKNKSTTPEDTKPEEAPSREEPSKDEQIHKAIVEAVDKGIERLRGYLEELSKEERGYKQISKYVDQLSDLRKEDSTNILKYTTPIAKIELNASRMDQNNPTVLKIIKAVSHLKDNFKAQGYEFIDMIGRPYNDGMRVIASFAESPSVAPGERIITGISQPQINYNGEMVQAAIITVTQNTTSEETEEIGKTPEAAKTEETSETPAEATEAQTEAQEAETASEVKAEVESEPEAEPVETEETRIESPTLEEQVAVLPEGQTQIVKVEPQQKTTRELESLPDSPSIGAVRALGNKWPGFQIELLGDKGIEALSVGKKPGDTLNTTYSWIRAAIKDLQGIIDHELGKIIAANPETQIRFMRVSIRDNATHDDYVQKVAFLAVDYNDTVARIHKEERGGVITAGNKQYLIVGTFGSVNREKNPAQHKYYTEIMDYLKPRSYRYFQAHPSERFWIEPDLYTHVEWVTNGLLVNQMLNDEEIQLRRVSELLEESRNPEHYTMRELKWGIQQEGDCVLVNVPDSSVVDFVRDVPSNVGAVFLFVPTANGRLIPAQIVPARLQELNEGALVEEIKDLIRKLASPSHSERVEAVRKLSQRIVLSPNDFQILVGTPERANITLMRGDTKTNHFELNRKDFSTEALINAIFKANPRVNVTAGVLSNYTTLKMYDDAGALMTYIAKLGTSNAKVYVYTTDSSGKPIKSRSLPNIGSTNAGRTSDLAKANKKLKSEMIGRTVYKQNDNGEWLDTAGKVVTDPNLLNQIELNNQVRAMTPAYRAVNTSNDAVEYYVINDDAVNPKIIAKRVSDKAVVILPINQARDIMERIAQQRANEAREENAKKALEDAGKQSEQPTQQPKQVQERQGTLTDNQLLDQATGNFETGPAQADTLVDQVTEGVTGEKTETQTPTQVAPPSAEPSSPATTNMGDGTTYTARELILEDVNDVLDLLVEKGIVTSQTNIEDWITELRELEVPTEGITDINNWINQIKGCK